MKKEKTTATVAKPRTVKIADKIHHAIRVLSVQERIPMQSLIEDLLTSRSARADRLRKQVEIA